MSNPLTDATPTATDPRRAAVTKARDAWISRLIDLSQRNNLIYFRQLKVGTLDLTAADVDTLAALLSGKKTTLHELLPNADRTQTTAQAKEIARKARENSDERGLQTLFLAAGFATWEPEQGKRPPESAVLLVPVTLEARNRSGPALMRAGEPQINPVLLHVLATTFRCNISAQSLLEAADTDPDRDDDPFNLDALLAKLVTLGAGIPKFEVRRRVVLGNFSFQKMAMVRDLRDMGDHLADSDIIASLSGDTAARAKIMHIAPEPDARQFDQIPPDTEFLALDTDSSQQKTIRLAQAGQSLVIQGPPGTGKSQVIANLIIAAAAERKRVLFVAEKRAALQVVLDRLQRVGLDQLALDLHGADTSRKIIASRLRSALENIAKGPPISGDNILPPFIARRTQMNAHANRLHTKRPPSDRSAFDLQTSLLHVPSTLRLRLRGNTLMRITPTIVSQTKDTLIEAAAQQDLFLGSSTSPWANANLSDGHAAQHAIDLVAYLVEQSLPTLDQILRDVLSPVRTVPPANPRELIQLLQLARDVNTFLTAFREEIFTASPADLVRALQPASAGFLARLFATITNGNYRQAKQRITALSSKPLTPTEMLPAAQSAQQLFERWKEAAFNSPHPTKISGAESALTTAESIATKLIELSKILTTDLTRSSLPDLHDALNALHSDAPTARRIPRVRQIQSQLKSTGLETLAAELHRAQLSPDTWPAAFETAWLRSCLEHAWAEDPDLATFNGQVHRKYAAEFRSLDQQRLKFAAESVCRRHVTQAIQSFSQHAVQASLIRHEANKKIRHVPFRKLMEDAPDVLAVLFPCLMCSPLSVSQLLPGKRGLFDLVIFDEASQVLPEDAVAALVRGSQAVVAGDEHQLPPTHFFAEGSDEDDETPSNENPADDSIAGFESLLKLMKSFVPAPMLEWHYRSRDEKLIAFSNRHIYSGRLITFPAPGGAEPAVQHILVDRQADTASAHTASTESDSHEVLRVVELVLDHARRELQSPPEKRRSLGVIALGITHSRRVEAAIEKALEDHVDLEPFFDPNLPDPFFVKNLERVQGDERDCILFTLGVSPDAGGKVSLTRFGPLNNREHGYGRLNVAVTRARQKMTVVSSFTAHAIDAAKEPSRGVELLRLYLQFAASGGSLGEDIGQSEIPSNTLEADIADALATAGIRTIPQWGVSSYRIDLVAVHPTRPGRFVMAIECDGATYHSAPTARDRDRLRQQHLEALGWKFHRIWSTDWFTRRDEEITRAQNAYSAAVAAADTLDGTPNQPPQSPPG